MVHVHLPEGSLPLFWVIVWTIVAAAIVGGCIFWLRKWKRIDSRLITLAGLLTAATFVAFQVPVPVPVPFVGSVHLSLTPLIGMIAGPGIGGIIVLIVNIFSAAIGHGGWGLIGTNVIVNMVEVIVAFGLFRWLYRSLKMKVFGSAAAATFLGLFAGNLAMIAIILISGIQGAGAPDAHDHEHALTEGPLADAHEHEDALTPESLLFLSLINIATAAAEAIATGYILAYIYKVRPDMLALGIRTEKKDQQGL
jgi:cobalt/nickel transport system permease protein